jgi:hypothetical protein
MKKGKVLLLALAGFLTLYACTNPFMERLFVLDKNTGAREVTFTVTFDSKGGSPVASQAVANGEKATRPDNPTKDDFGFVNWYDNPECTGAPYDFDTPVTANKTLYAKWTQSTAAITITVEQITDLSLDEIEGGTISRGGEGYPETITFELENPGSYDSYTWSIDGVGRYAGITITGSGSSFTVDAADARYNSSGRHAVYLLVYKDGVPYSKTIWVEIVAVDADEADFGPEAAISNTFNVSNEDEWNTAKTAISNGGGNKNYIINVIGDFTVTGSTDNTFGNTASGITVSLRGDHKLTLSGNGNLIRTATGQTVIVRDLTLQGISGNNNSVVNVNSGTFTMQSGEIKGNTINNDNGGGVHVAANGTFTMNGGKISGNTSNGSGDSGRGGGVFVAGTGATFTMNNGEISGNTAQNNGSGVYVRDHASFTMNGGEIFGNTATNGGGVYVRLGSFTMKGGKISGNTASTNGGGVAVQTDGTFKLYSGEISDNTAPNGSGVYLYDGGTASYGPNGTGTALTTTDGTIIVKGGILQNE